MKHRDTHYWLWFIFFGVVAGAINFVNHATIDSESTWLLVTGLLGLIVSARWLNEGKFARLYDLIIGIIFTVVGLLGILLAFKISLIPHLTGTLGTYVNPADILGLSLGVLPSLVHAVLGLTSLNHGIRNE